MKAGILLTLVAAAFAWVPIAAQASTRHGDSSWYWSPGACKSELQNYGVSIGDGRSFNIEKAYCVGLHNHCWLSSGLRRYKVFIAVVRSYDGVVRSFQMTVTGHHSWSGSKLKIIEPYMSLSQFNASYAPVAWNVAAQENQSGCFDIHP
jgi:hypothetical protein